MKTGGHGGGDRLRRISIVGTLPPLLGISPYCSGLATALADDVEVEFISFDRHYPARLYPGGVLEDSSAAPPSHPRLVVHRRLNWYNPLGWIAEGTRLTGDVLHVQWWSLPTGPVMFTLLAIARARGIPRILTVHNVQSHERSTAFRWATRAIFSQVNRFIVHSQVNANELRDLYGVPGDRIDVVPHGALEAAQATPATTAEIRRRLRLTPESRVLLIFGAIRPYKGIDIALQAMQSIVQQQPDTVLLIVGALRMDFLHCHALIERYGLHDHVRLVLDYVPEEQISAYFALSELVVLPYRHFSSQSGVGMLALSMKRPLVVSDVGALPELVGDRRWVVPPEDPAGLADRISQVLRDPDLQREMLSAAEERAQRFGWGSIAQTTLGIYRTLWSGTRID